MELRELIARAMLDKLQELDVLYGSEELDAVGIDGDVNLLELADVVLNTMRGLDGTT